MSSKESCRWHVVADEPFLVRVATEKVVAAAAKAIKERGKFQLVLAGGNTPRGLYFNLRAIQTEWSAWHIYFSDERCLPPNDIERNSYMATQVWLNHVPIVGCNFHRIPAELGASQAARLYSEVLKNIEEFDLVLLGLGEDGHTASLFPHHDWGASPDSPDVLAIFNSPKPPAQRVSLSARRLSRAKQVLFMVSGEAKREAVTRWHQGDDIPARVIAPVNGVEVLIESSLFENIEQMDRKILRKKG